MGTDRAADRTEIAELLNRYSFAMTDRDWDAWLACFTPDAHVDYSTAGGVVGAPAEMAAWLQGTFGMFDVVISQSTNLVVDFDGDDAADVRSVYKMVMRIPGDQPTYMEACGWYKDRITRGPDGWRIADRYENLLYVR